MNDRILIKNTFLDSELSKNVGIVLRKWVGETKNDSVITIVPPKDWYLDVY